MGAIHFVVFNGEQIMKNDKMNCPQLNLRNTQECCVYLFTISQQVLNVKTSKVIKTEL